MNFPLIIPLWNRKFVKTSKIIISSENLSILVFKASKNAQVVRAIMILDTDLEQIMKVVTLIIPPSLSSENFGRTIQFLIW